MTKKELEEKLIKNVNAFKALNEKEKELDPDNQEDIDKIKRLKSFLAIQIQDLKKQIDNMEEINTLSDTIEIDEQTNSKAFSKNSLKEVAETKYRTVLIPYFIISFILFLYAISQRFLYKRAFISSIESKLNSTAVDNFFFLGGFLCIVIFIYFTIFILNAKFLKKKNQIILFTYCSIIIIFISYLHLNVDFELLNLLTNGQWLGMIGAVIFAISLFLLMKEFKYQIKRKKVIIKKVEE